MKICITSESIALFGSYFKRNLPQVIQEGKTYPEIVKELYHEALISFQAKSPRDKEVVIQHLLVIPQVMQSYIAEKPGVGTSGLNVEVANSALAVHNGSQSDAGIRSLIDTYTGYVSEAPIVIRKEQPSRVELVSHEFGKVDSQEMLFNPNLQAPYSENIQDPAKVLETNIMRNIITSKNKEGYRFKMIYLGDARATAGFVDTMKQRLTSEMVFVIVDKRGNIVYFNSEGTTAGPHAYQFVAFGFKTEASEFNKQKEARVASLIKQGTPRDKAISLAQRELDSHLEALHQGITAARYREDVYSEIDLHRSSIGTNEYRESLRMPTRNISNLSDIKVGIYYVGTSSTPEITIPFANKKWRLDAKTLDELSEKELDILAELMTNNDLKIDGESLTQEKRKQLVSNYIQLGPASGIYMNFPMKGTDVHNVTSVALGATDVKFAGFGKKDSVERKAATEEFKKAFKEYIKGYRLKTGTTSSTLVSTSPAESLLDVQHQGQQVQTPDGKFVRAYKPEVSFGLMKGATLEGSFEMVTDINNDNLIITTKNRLEHILDNSVSNVVPNSNNELRGFGGYLAFTSPKTKFFTEDSALDSDVFFMSQGQLNQQSKATPQEEIDADRWFNEHPMSKVLQLTMSSEVHEKGPAILAQFFKNSINLYAGSDKTSLYHETFHAYFNGILTAAERADIYAELRSKSGSFTTYVKGRKNTASFDVASDLQLEEYLAEEFRSYARTAGIKEENTSKVARFFENLLKLLKSFFGKLTVNEVSYLDKVGPLADIAFRNLYKGNVDISKFQTPALEEALYQSFETELELTHQEVSLVMNSTKALMSDFLNRAISPSSDLKVNAQLASKLMTLAKTSMVDEEKYHNTSEEITKEINILLEQSDSKNSGKALFTLNTNPMVLKTALRYIEQSFKQRLEYFQQELASDPTSIIAKENVELLTKVVENFGDISLPATELKEDRNTIAGLYLNKYSNISLSRVFSQEQDLDEDEGFGIKSDDDRKSAVDLADDHTLQLLSSVIAYSDNGQGDIKVNRLGVGQLQSGKTMFAKVIKATAGKMTIEEMYASMEQAAIRDKEIRQVLTKLGSLPEQGGEYSVEEELQRTAFWQSMIKADVKLLEFVMEKKDTGVITNEAGEKSTEVPSIIEAKTSKSRSGSSQIGRTWADNFNHNSQTNSNNLFTEDGRLNVKALLNTLSDKKVFLVESGYDGALYHGVKQKGSGAAVPLHVADPFDFLERIGIVLPRTTEIREMLRNGNAELGLQPGVVSLLIESLRNRMNAYNIEKQFVASFNELFEGFSYADADGNRASQSNTDGYRKMIENLAFAMSDESTTFMGTRADGEKQSEKTYHSSMTMVLNTINNAAHYDDLINTPGMEFLNYENNPFVAAGWLVQMFRLNLPEGHANRGARDTNIKINAESLSGSKVVYENSDKGVAAISSDEITKFISDFHLTLAGRQEIMRAEVKSTSLTVYAQQYATGSSRVTTGPIVNSKQIREVFSNRYVESRLYLYNQFVGHLEAELIRINRINELKETIKNNPDKVFEFDKAYLQRGSEFSMFEAILDDELKASLKSLDITDSFTLNESMPQALKIKVELALKSYFSLRANELYVEKAEQLVIGDNIIEENKLEDESAADTLRHLFDVFTVNNFIQNANYSSLFLGDPALYNVEGEDYHKRIAGMISTGKMFRFDSSWYNFVNSSEFNANSFAKKYHAEKGTTLKKGEYNGTLNTGIIRESKQASTYINHYKEYAGIDTSEYEALTEADGSGWISFDTYRMLAMSSNEWSHEQENLYQQMLNGESLDYNKIQAAFPIRKYQYYGPVTTDSQDINNAAASEKGLLSTQLGMMAFHKYALMPLIPDVIKGTKLEQLHDKMMKDGLDYITMASGSKLSSVTKINAATINESKPVFDDIYSADRIVQDVPVTVNKIHVRYLKSQVHVHEGFKGKINLPSQMRKMIYLGVMDNGIPMDYKGTAAEWKSLKTESEKRKVSNLYDWAIRMESTLGRLQRSLKEDLLEDIGMKAQTITDVNGNKQTVYQGDTRKLVQYIETMLQDEDLLPEEIEFIKTETGELIPDLSLSLHAEKIEKILITMVDKKLRRLKVNGEGLAQGTGVMHEKATFTKPIAEEGFQNGTNELRTYGLLDQDGNAYEGKEGQEIAKIAKMEVKIAMQGSFKELFNLTDHTGSKIKVYNKVETANGQVKKVFDYNASLAKLNAALQNDKWRMKHEHLLTLTGPRIPTQAENSLEAAVVKEFLPPTAGTIIILPSEIVAKAGSDYDYDKLYLMFPNIVTIGNSVELQHHMDVTESSDELYAQQQDGRKMMQSLRDELKELRDLKTKGESYADPVKKAIAAEYNLTEDIRDLINDVKGHLKAAEAGSWKYKNMTVEERESYQKQYVALLSDYMIIEEQQEELISERLKEKLGEDVYNNAFSEIDSKIAAAKERIANYQSDVMDELQRKIYGKSTKGIENELQALFAERITMPNNFSELVKANHTSDVKPSMDTTSSGVVAQELADTLTGGYNKRNRRGKEVAADTKTISRTTIYDYRYNLLKHQENTVGLDSLGIAAVVSTYYAMFTRIGASIEGISVDENEAYIKAIATLADSNANQIDKAAANKLVQKYSGYRLRMPHNSVIENGKQSIALGFRKSVDGKTISDVIGQLINGYVDVAKDAWIFNIQGNKENTPILLFMVMAGVPVKQAIYFTSVPAIKEYNSLKKQMSGVYSKLDRTGLQSPIYGKKDARSVAIKTLMEKYQDSYKGQLLFGEETPETLAAHLTSEFTMDDLKEMIKSKTRSFKEMQAFAHYLELEKMANDLTEFQGVTKFDTQKISSISDAQSRVTDTQDLQGKVNSIPNSWYTDMASTPIGAFNNDQFIVDLFSKYYGLRNHPLVVQASNKAWAPKGVDKTVIRNDFKNDFVFYLYQNSFYNPTTYAGYSLQEVDRDYPIQFTDDVVSYNRSILESDRLKMTTWFLSNTGRAIDLFPSFGHYLRYRIELEKIKALSAAEFESNYGFMFAGTKKVMTADAQYVKAALYESQNELAMFDSNFGYGSMLKSITRAYPDLTKRYDLLSNMLYDYSAKHGKLNLKVNSQDSETIAVYRENLQDLKNSPLPEIRSFFRKFDHMAIMQTGMNRRTSFDLTRLIDTKMFQSVVDNGIGTGVIEAALNEDYSRILNREKLDKIQFLTNFNSSFSTMVKNSYAIRNRGYSYVKDDVDTPNKPSAIVSSSSKAQIVSSFDTMGVDKLLIDAESMFDEEGGYNNDLLSQMDNTQFVIENRKLLVPDGEDQKAFDEMLYKRFGIDNTGFRPRLMVLATLENEKGLSIAGVTGIQDRHGIKDQTMASLSSKVIARATVAKPGRPSSTMKYLESIAQSSPEAIAGYTDTFKFKKADAVWIFGSGVFEKAYVGAMSKEEYESKIEDTFNEFYKPQIDAAIKAGVSKFYIGDASGIDELALEYMKANNFVPVVRYTIGGVYNEMVKGSELINAKSDLYDINESDVDLFKAGFGFLFTKSELADNVNRMSTEELMTADPSGKILAELYVKVAKKFSSRQQQTYEMNKLFENKGRFVGSSSLYGRYIEKILMERRNNKPVDQAKPILISQQKTVEKATDLDIKPGRYVEFMGQTYITIKAVGSSQIQVYNPLAEGAASKKAVSKANVKVLQDQAQLVSYRDAEYLVTPKKNIISLTSGKMMKWDSENGDRIAILKLADNNTTLNQSDIDNLKSCGE